MRVRDELTVAMADPHDLAVDRYAGSRLSGCRIRPVFTLASGIDRLLPRCYEDDFAVDSVTADLDVEQLELETEAIDLDLSGAKRLAEGSPVINLVNYAIVQAVSQGASDIHIEPGPKSTSVRFRIDGSLREVMKPRKDLHAAIVSRIKVMAKLDIAEHRQPQDGRLHVRMNRHDVDLRVSTLPTVLGEKVVMRVLDRQSITFDLNRLGLPNESLAIVHRMLPRPHGLVLVTGPTGSGKTTTLYSAIELIKGIERNIITVEDPVEYQLELINQVQVQTENGVTFAKALRSILRQDPDVIMVGEIRDRETAEMAIQAALTGHLVLSTLHTNDSVVGDHPTGRHGRRTIQDRRGAGRRRRPAVGAKSVRRLPRALLPVRQAARGDALPRGRPPHVCAKPRLFAVFRVGIPRPIRHLRVARKQRRASTDDQRRSDAGRASSRSHGTHAVVRGASPGRGRHARVLKKSVASHWRISRRPIHSTLNAYHASRLRPLQPDDRSDPRHFAIPVRGCESCAASVSVRRRQGLTVNIAIWPTESFRCEPSGEDASC